MDDNIIEFSIPDPSKETVETVEETTETTEVIETTETTEEVFNPLDYIKGDQNTNPNNSSEEIDTVKETVESEIKPTVQQEKNAYTWAEETGRKPEDYFRLHKDWSNEDGDLALRTYLKEKNPYYTDEDIQDVIDEKYSVDEFATDPDKAERKSKRLYNEDVSEAKKYLIDKFSITTKEDVVQNVEIPKEYQEAMSLVQQQQEFAQQAEQNRNHYLEVLNESYQDFNGFDFDFEVTDVNGTSQDVQISYVPPKTDLQNTIDIQKDTNKLFDQFGKVDESGNFRFTDGKGFMKMLAFAANMKSVMRLAYEQGAASATENLVKNDLKNINISNPSKQNTSSSGMSFSVE